MLVEIKTDLYTEPKFFCFSLRRHTTHTASDAPSVDASFPYRSSPPIDIDFRFISVALFIISSFSSDQVLSFSILDPMYCFTRRINKLSNALRHLSR